MDYIFRGKLCGFLCNDCSEPLSNVTVRLYKPSNEQNVTLLAVAKAQDTFHQVNEQELKGKEKLLLAEVQANAVGEFEFRLSEKGGYHGEAFDIDFYCGNGIFGPRPKKPIQFHITTLQPQWRATKASSSPTHVDQQMTYAWDYCVSSKWWCNILKQLDRWVICGRVVDCDSGKAAAGVRVFAYDVDLLQDDPLGSAYTDAYGHFKIEYTSADFSKTIFSWLNVEWPAGPDVYFRIESASGLVLLKEDRNTGHRNDRANAHNCMCVKLCVRYDGPTDTPWFTHVGKYKITGDIDAQGRTAAIRTTVPVGSAFYSTIKLTGYVPRKVPTDMTKALHYRFLYSLDNINWQPVTTSLLSGERLPVGEREITWNGVDDWQDIVIHPGAAPSAPDTLPPDNYPNPVPDHVVGVDAQGWIRVDQLCIGGGFHGPLLAVDTTKLVPGGAAASPSDQAGNAPATPRSGAKVYFKFQTTDDPANPASLHLREQAIIAVIYVNNWHEVNLLKLDELTAAPANGCNPINDHAHVRYTVDHEFIRHWAVAVQTAALPHITVHSPGTSGNVPRGIAQTIDLALTSPPAVTPPLNEWPPCAYKLSLATRRSVTTGEADDEGRTVEILFCR